MTSAWQSSPKLYSTPTMNFPSSDFLVFTFLLHNDLSYQFLYFSCLLHSFLFSAIKNEFICSIVMYNVAGAKDGGKKGWSMEEGRASFIPSPRLTYLWFKDIFTSIFILSNGPGLLFNIEKLFGPCTFSNSFHFAPSFFISFSCCENLFHMFSQFSISFPSPKPAATRNVCEKETEK